MNKSYYMEKNGAVKIPDKYKKMFHEEISNECARLAETVKNKAKATVKKQKLQRRQNLLFKINGVIYWV